MALDRGSKKFFHGREKEKKQFRFFLNRLIKDKSRTSFLIQGSPGVGKTTLWEHCCDLAEKQGWNTVVIDISTLYNIKDFRKRLGREHFWKFWGKEKLGLNPSITHPEVGTVGLGMELEINHHTFIKTLNSIKNPTIMVLDEAQNLNQDNITKAQKSVIMEVLDNIHNKKRKSKSSVVLLFSGLGRTREILKDYGISRFATSSVINLQAIDKLSERKIIYDWLVQEGHVNKNDSNLNHWIDKISEQTYQWPRHIASYGVHAVHFLEEHGSKLTNEGLKIVLEEGKNSRFEYYKSRMDGFSHSEVELIVDFLKTQKDIESFSDRDIIPFFERTLSTEKSEDLFQKSWHSGIFHQRNDMKYSISVPSMKDWFIQYFGNEK